MKKLVSLSLLLFFTSVFISAQNDTLIKYLPNSYRLDLPEEWEKQELLNAIAEILPQTLGEYIDSSKKYCLDCNADFTVSIIIQKATKVKGKKMYHFSAALGLFDTSGKEIMDLVLISPEEKHKIDFDYKYNRTQVSYSNDNIRYSNKNITVYSNIWVYTNNNTVTRSTQNTNSYRSANTPDENSPSIMDLLLIAEKRIFEIRNILQDLKQKEQSQKN